MYDSSATLVVSVGDLADDLDHEIGSVGLTDSGEVEHRLTVLDLDTAALVDPIRLEQAARTLAAAPGVVVGATSDPRTVPDALAEALTLSLVQADRSDDRRLVAVPDLGSSIAAVDAAIRHNPSSSAVLAQVLRTTQVRPVVEGLRVESLAYSTLLGGREFARWLVERGPKTLPEQSDPILVHRSGAELTITLNNPARRNAFSAAMRDALCEALQLALLDDSIVLLRLTGNGPAFCSGGELAEFGTQPDPVITHVIRSQRSVGAMLARLGTKVRVELHGACIGAGIELPSFAAEVIATPDTVIRLPEIAMGLIPGAGGTVSITGRIGRWRTAFLALTGLPIDSQTALGWGLVDDIN
jgi:hypothetical protein